MDYIKRIQNGIYINIGKSAETIAEDSGADKSLKEDLVSYCMRQKSDAIVLLIK
ncbi:MAG: hypothetical protein AB7V16_10350 [Vulcanibacillus sp.]